MSARGLAERLNLSLTPQETTLVRQLGRLPGEGESPLEHLIATYAALPPADAIVYLAEVIDFYERVLLPALRRCLREVAR
jgi:hypothetical protein